MILGGLTVACCNIATVNTTMAVGEKKQPSFDLPLLAPVDLSAEFVQSLGLQGAGSEDPTA